MEQIHEIANLLPLLTGDVKATVTTIGYTHHVELSPSVNQGHYYVSVVSLPGGACEYFRRPVKTENIGELLKALGVDTSAVRWTISECEPYAITPDESQANNDEPFLYFIEGAGKIKIGVAEDPESRLGSFMTGSPVPLRLLAVCKGGYKKERRLHKRFEHLHSHGEWFYATQELLDFVEEIQCSQ